MRILACACTVALALSSTSASAQDVATPAVSKGGATISGGLAFSSAGGDLTGNDRLNTLAIGPGFGYFVSDGLSLGADIDYLYLSQGSNDLHSLGIGPAIAYYFNTRTRALPVVQANVLLLNLGGNGDSDTGFGFTVGGGVNVLASEHLGVAIDVSYLWERFKPEGASESLTDNTVLVGVTLVGFIH